MQLWSGSRFRLLPTASGYGRRASVEREFGRLKHEWALGPVRVRGLDRVRLHADLTILAKLACALSRARAVPAPGVAAYGCQFMLRLASAALRAAMR
jgi:hypothetical protein